MDVTRIRNALHGHYGTCRNYKNIMKAGNSYTQLRGNRTYGSIPSASIVQEQFIHPFPVNVLELNSD